MSNAEKILLDFVIDEYPNRDEAFATSWTTSSLFATKEEELLTAVFQSYEDWLREIPSKMLAICISNHIEQDSEDFAKVVKFCQDAIADLMDCNIRDAQ